MPRQDSLGHLPLVAASCFLARAPGDCRPHCCCSIRHPSSRKPTRGPVPPNPECLGAGSLWVAACGSEGSPAIVNGAIVSPGLPIGADGGRILAVRCARDTLFRLPRSQARPSSTALRKEASSRRRPAHRSKTYMIPCSHYYLRSLSWTSRTFYFPDSRDLLEVLGGLSRQREGGGP